jgi:electron transfer flavoprotein alpha subunit
MSNFIVLVKQVPDVSQITDNVFDPETGNLLRSRLASVINELDTHALAFADYMKKLSGDDRSKIIALSMGPPMAEEVLRYCLARCADTAILLTDKALGGADTFATANPLAFAIKKIVSDFFGGNNDYFVITGMQSVDGDTAQVPPQVAEELSLPCIAYVTDARFAAGGLVRRSLGEGGFDFTRIISGGYQIVTPKKTPAVVTVAKYEYPLFASFAATRSANHTPVIQWSGEDIKADHIGVKGSKTRVIRIFPPAKSSRKCRQAPDVKTLAQNIIESLKSDSLQTMQTAAADDAGYLLPEKRQNWFDRSFEGTENENEDYKILADKLQTLGIGKEALVDPPAADTKKQILDVAGEHFHKNALDDMLAGLQLTAPAFKGEVWVVAEQHNGVIHPATFELVGKARELADCLETTVGVCLAGFNIDPLAKDLIAAGADHIYTINHKLLADFDPTAYRKAIADCIGKYWPQIVLFAATPQGRSLAPMISCRLGCGLTADCTGLDIKDSSRKGQIAILFQTRPALGGNVMATICTKDSPSQMATARPGVFKRLPADPSRTGKIIQHKVKLSENDVGLEILKTELGTGKVNFNADIIVSGGRGLQNQQGFDSLLKTFSASLSKKFNTAVEIGASRAAVEQGFIDRIHQVGQTGTSVAPKLYFALGISGAIQHLVGIANARTIIAVNSDTNAPIFRQCDYYLVGTAENVIPEVIEHLEKLQINMKSI